MLTGGEICLKYIAHVRESDGEIQTVAEHLLDVKNLAEKYGEKIGIKHICGLAGMLHDLGKYSEEFREYILEAVNNPDAPPKRGSVDHSTAGGRMLYQLFHVENDEIYNNLLAEIVGNAIISHHSYLKDFVHPNLTSPYLKRVDEKVLEGFDLTKDLFYQRVMSEKEFYDYVEKAALELEAFVVEDSDTNLMERLMFLTKYVFSTLIDGDRTNTRQFVEMDLSNETAPDSQSLMATYYERLMDKINSFEKDGSANNPINRLRSEMSKQCEAFAEQVSGIYTLSIPTGGGKTLASLRYGLKHSIKYNKKRIIYVVPFTTIIEQNAADVRSILQDDEHILEHHSNVIFDENINDEAQDATSKHVADKLKLAKDNWDSPIIFTTMVQFLNTFYAKGSRNIRRLHNLSEAVIIFDEVQKVPISCVSMFNQALNFLKNTCRSSLILCTATQPALDFVENRLEVEPDAEMIKKLDDVTEAFKRVEIIDKASSNTFNTDSLVEFVREQLNGVKNILIILNTKRVVRDLYNALNELDLNIPIYHLSTSMCPKHRQDILYEVRSHLDKKEPVICISTQLIEAGVDVSFECVIRSLTGLDSIAQAAGRCNRHGEQFIRPVYIIDHEEENLKYLQEIEIGKRITRKILVDMKTDPDLYGGYILSQAALSKYFKEFYQAFRNDMNYPVKNPRINMVDLLSAYKNNYEYAIEYKEAYKQDLPLYIPNSYGTAAQYFEVIKNMTTSALVPYGEGKEIISQLISSESIEDISYLLKKAQHYSVNLYRYEEDELAKNQGLSKVFNDQILILNEHAYNNKYGLDIEGEGGLDFEIF